MITIIIIIIIIITILNKLNRFSLQFRSMSIISWLASKKKRNKEKEIEINYGKENTSNNNK